MKSGSGLELSRSIRPVRTKTVIANSNYYGGFKRIKVAGCVWMNEWEQKSVGKIVKSTKNSIHRSLLLVTPDPLFFCWRQWQRWFFYGMNIKSRDTYIWPNSITKNKSLEICQGVGSQDLAHINMIWVELNNALDFGLLVWVWDWDFTGGLNWLKPNGSISMSNQTAKLRSLQYFWSIQFTLTSQFNVVAV